MGACSKHIGGRHRFHLPDSSFNDTDSLRYCQLSVLLQ